MKKPKRSLPMIERFERFFDKKYGNECWTWIGYIDKNGKGYGRFSIGKKDIRAHRVSYEIYKGPIPHSMHILHSCDNPSCVNPAHLRAGTAKENSDDSWIRDRKTSVRKLSVEQIVAIKNDSRVQSDIALAYGVHPCMISRIKSGKRGYGILKMMTVSQEMGG